MGFNGFYLVFFAVFLDHTGFYRVLSGFPEY